MEAQPPPQPSPPHYPDSLDSSPRSRNTDFWDEPYPPPTANKLRLMLSYGGHISPRSHDKTLCYVGGETRIVVVDRHTALSDLSTRFSKTFLNGRPIAIKYQLPNEDLDSLISVTTDEDFENMIEEFDQRSSNSSSSKPSRIRLFLFPDESGLESVKSEDWLTGSGFLDGGLSETASVNCLLGLDDEVAASRHGSNNFALGPEDAAAEVGSGKNLKQGQDVQSVLVSPMLDANSSFGSTSSSPSVVNLRPIKVHVEDGGSTGGGGGGVRGQDQKVEGIEEQFAKLGVGDAGQKQDNEIVVLASPVNVSPVPAAGEFRDRVVSDDERSDHGVPVGYRRQPNSELQMQTQSQPQAQAQALPPQFQQKSTGGVDLPSPDSVSSDSSVTNATSRPKSVNVINQDQLHIQPGASRIPITSVDPNRSLSDPHGLVQMQQHVPDPRYVLEYQRQQQQQALQHQFDPQQQQQQRQQQALQHQFDQQQQQQALQHQFDQQQQQQALQHQFDQQQQQRQQQQLALQHQFDQQQQQQALQHQFDQQQQQHALQHQFDQQHQQQALEHQFDQQQQHQQQQALQHQFDQQQQQKQALQHQFDNQQQEEAQQPQKAQQLLQAQQSQQAQQLLQAQQSHQAQQLLQAQQSQKFMHGTHFIHQTPAGPVSIPAYYPVYPSQQQLHPQHHYQLDQQYPGYYVPTRQAQAYNLSMQQQANLAESATAIPSSQTQNPTNPAAMLPPSAAYTPMRSAPLPNSEITTASSYRTATASTPQLVQVPTTQHQQQYVAYSQIQHPSQSVAPNSAAPANYAYNYEDPAHAQIFYAQNLAPTKPSQSRP